MCQENAFNTLLKDTGAIMLQLKRAYALHQKQSDSFALVNNHALESSRALAFEEGIAIGLLQQAQEDQNKSDFTHSVVMLQSALPLFNNHPEQRKKKVRALCFAGDAYWYLNKTDSVAYYYYRALDEINAAGITDSVLLLDTYSKLLLLWLNLNDTYSPSTGAIDKYTESAILYFNKSAQQQHTSFIFRTSILINQGHIKRMQKHYDSSRYYYRQYLQLMGVDTMTHLGPESWEAAMILNICESFIEEKKGDSALYYARVLLSKIEFKKNENQIYYLVARYLEGKALCLQKKYKKAIEITVPALQLAQQKKLLFRTHYAHEALAEAYAATGEYQKAWKEQKTYITITDSLRKTSNIQAISQMEMRYRMAESKKELAEKELAITRKDASLRNQRTLSLAISIVSMLLLLIGFLLYRHKSSKQRIKLLQIEKQMEISHLNAMIEGEEKERRRLATELHDGIGGLLGSIRLQLSSAIRNYKTQDRSADFKFILKLLENTYADLRKTAHNLMPETLQQEGLETATRLFCLGISPNAKPDIIFESVGELPPIPPSIELSLYRMIQELVHNIIKHANASKALVQLVYIDNKLGLTVEDDGQGFDVHQKVQKQQGMGLSAIRKRVKSLGGNMDISASPGEGTSIYIEIIISRNENSTVS
jgi:signal transduction histidine kinase